MGDIYGPKWTSDKGQRPTRSDDKTRLTSTGDTWARALADLDGAAISGAITACATGATGEWPPSLPEFRRLALEAVGDGLPTVDAAYREACEGSYHPSRHQWSHPTVIDAARAVGFRALSHEQPRTTWPAYRRAYEDACRRYRAGEPLADAVPEGLPQSPGAAQPADRQTARRHLDSIRVQLRRRPNNDCAQVGEEARA
ncbi:hypothetical protein [Thiohalospira halophila]|nr:hypothetical protein [Thiohalospira halophila]